MKRPIDDTLIDSSSKNEEAEALSQVNIQRLIHFIWAGGDENMPDTSLYVVKKWAEANPEFAVIIWVDAWDKVSGIFEAKSLKDILIFYRQKFELAAMDVFLNELPTNYARKAKAPVIIRDITQHNMVNEYVRYEIDKIVPNFGSSSDILRYNILWHYGGVYIDSDVAPGQDALTTCRLFTAAHSDHVLYLDHVSQKVNPPAICFEVFELFHPIALDEKLMKIYEPIPGNDSFICTPANPLMAEILRLSLDNYQLPKLNNMQKFILAAYGDVDYTAQTIDRTGTTPVQVALLNSKPRSYEGEYYHMKCVGQRVIVCPLRHTGAMLVQPIRNTKHWISIIDWRKIDLTMAMAQLIKQTHQELQFFGVLRLDDHIDFLKKLAGKKHVNSEQLISNYLNQLETTQLAFSEIKVGQCVSLDPHLHQFYAKHQLFASTQILQESNPAHFKQVCDIATSTVDFTHKVDLINRFGPQFIEQSHYAPGEITRLHRALSVAVDFIELLQSDKKKFARMLGDDCMQCLKQVLTLAAHFEEKFADEELQFNTNQVEHLLDDFQLNQKANDLADADQMMKAFLSATYEEDNPFDEDR